MTSQQEISALIAEQSRASGSLAEALRTVRATLPNLVRETANVIDLFPRRHTVEPEGKLYRCRGMIQEVRADVSLFCANSADFFSDNNETCDTEPEYLDAVDLYVVPVPCNSHFYEVVESDAIQRDAAAVAAANALDDSLHPEAPPLSLRKRQLRDDTSAEDAFKCPRLGDVSETNSTANNSKNSTCRHAQRHTMAAAAVDGCGGNDLNLPHPATATSLRTACIVTVVAPRDGNARETFRTNDVLDFYGYLHSPADVDGAEEEEGDDGDLLQFSSWGAAEHSTGLVSRLLCLAYEAVPVTGPVPQPLSGYFDDAREYALHYLSSELCHGDSLLAQFLLLHLCSRVSAHNPVTPVGDIPMLICSPSSALSAATISQGLSAIVPVAEVLLTAKELRALAQPLTPKHDGQRNYLRTGTLQVANGSHVTIDCAGLGGGEPWCDALFAAVHKQQLLLEYPYQTVELPINVGFLAVCTKLEEACTPLDFGLRLFHPCTRLPASLEESEKEAAFAPSSDLVREYLTHVQRVEPSFDDLNDLHQQISESLVALSNEQPHWNNREPLVHNNSFSIAAALLRALASSRGHSDIQESDLTTLLDLECQRIARTCTS